MKKRLINIELLRIISMFFIILMHSYDFGMKEAIVSYHFNPEYFNIYIKPLTVIAVNCFVIISGFFSIKFSVRGIMRFWFTCFFYSILLYLIYGSINGFQLKEFVKACLPITKNGTLWFVKAYFILYVISPFINNYIEKHTSKGHLYGFLALTFLNVIFGFCLNDSFNALGFNYNQLIYIYYIGRMINIYYDNFNNYYKYIPKIFVVNLILMMALSYCNLFSFSYNNPLIIISTVCFFCIFLRIKVNSRYIEYLAKGTFGVYIIHENQFIRTYYYRLYSELLPSFCSNIIQYYVCSIFLIVAIFIMLCVIENNRNKFLKFPR